MCKLSSAGPPCSRHARAPGPGCSLAPKLEGLPRASPRGPARPGRLSFPHCPSGCMPAHPARRHQGSGWVPHASWARTSANLAVAPATRGAEEQKTRRSLPLRKRQPMTPQKKSAFPSVSLQTNGRPGPSCRSLLSTQKGPSTPRHGELGANSCLLQAGPARPRLLAGPRLESETEKRVETTTYQQQCFISCAQFMCVFLSFLLRNHYE